MSSVRSVISFQVKPGREADFEAAFALSGMLTRPLEFAGFQGADLVRAVDGSGEYLVIGSWASAEAYRDWQRRSTQGAPEGSFQRLLETLDDPRPGRLFAVVEPLP